MFGPQMDLIVNVIILQIYLLICFSYLFYYVLNCRNQFLHCYILFCIKGNTMQSYSAVSNRIEYLYERSITNSEDWQRTVRSFQACCREPTDDPRERK